MAEQEDREERERTRAKIEKIKESNFKQQNLSPWRPKATYGTYTVTFVLFSFIFLGLGAALFTMSNKLFELSVRYDETCLPQLQYKGHSCTVKLPKVEKTVKGPVYVYYQLNNYYQNHRRYVKSRDYRQLMGQWKEAKQLDDCIPAVKVGEMHKHQQFNTKGVELTDKAAPSVPCGLVAKSFFNDTIVLKKGSNNVKMDSTKIAWDTDVKYSFKNIKKHPQNKKWEDFQWTNMEDPHFIVWMRTAGLPTFRKLYAIIDHDLVAGSDYTAVIENNYEVRPFKGEKHIVMATTNMIGGKNYFLAYAFLTMGSLSFIFAMVIVIANSIIKKNKQE